MTTIAREGGWLWEADPVDLPRADDVVAGLHRAHYGALVGLARLLVDTPAEAEEMVQEAFVRLVASWRRLDDPDKALAYLRSTVLNLSRSRLRRRAVARRWLAAQRPAEATVETLSGGERATVLAALATLPRRQRECVALRYYGDLSEREIAAALGISEGSVKTHTHRAMAALAATLEGLR